MFISCKKPSTGIDFSHATYQTLGTYTSSGEPNYLLASDTISQNLSSFIASMLPESVNLTKSHPELFNSGLPVDLKIEQTSDVFITFVSAGTGLSNTFAFYTYPTNAPPKKTQDIKSITYIFPRAGKSTPLKAGDKVKIGSFNAGTSIGLIVLQSAWNTTSSTIDNSVPHFCSYDPFNPENDANLKKHAVLINYAPENKILVGFEDLDRSFSNCDNDFNDIIFYWSFK